MSNQRNSSIKMLSHNNIHVEGPNTHCSSASVVASCLPHQDHDRRLHVACRTTSDREAAAM